MIDTYLVFADAQTIETGDGATELTNTVDLGLDRDIGPGKMVYWCVQLDINAGDELTFTLETDGDSAFGSTTTIGTLVFSENDPAGTKKWIAFPSANERYLRVLVTPTGDDATSTFTSYLSDSQPSSSTTSYADNVPD